MVKRGRFLLQVAIVAATAVLCPLSDSSRGAKLPTEEELRAMIANYPDSAALRAQLASLYFAKGTVTGRLRATRQLKQALRIEPRKQDYHLMLAEIYFEGTFWNYGVEHLKQAIDIEPANAFAHCRLGKAYLDRAVDEWEERRFKQAMDEFDMALTLKPGYPQACTNMALCYFDLGFPDSSIHLLSSLPQDSLGVEGLLILGMSFCEENQMEDSYQAFFKALKDMDDERRRAFMSTELIASSEELKDTDPIWPGNLMDAIDHLWKRRDPNPATPVNERLVEHLARVAFADFHFSVPRLGKMGRETTRGEVYIRYGRPVRWFYDPFGTNFFADETVMPYPGQRTLDPNHRHVLLERLASSRRSRPLRLDKPRWVWQYEGFTLNFEDAFLNGDYTFPYERDWTAYTYAYLQKKIPEIYEVQIKKSMRVILDALNFIDSAGRSCLKIIYACDTRGVDFIPYYEWPRGEFDVEIAILDDTYDELARSSFSGELVADSSVLYQTQYPLIGTWVTSVSSGPSLAAVSVESRGTQSIGFTTTRVNVREFGENLEISDIELRFAQDGPPNPSHVYLRRGKVYLAFSIYNVKVDNYGTGDVEITYRLLKKEQPVPLFKRFLSLLSVEAEDGFTGMVTSLSSSYNLRTQGSTAHEVIGIDLSPLMSGDYMVEITARDRIADWLTEANTLVRIASELDR